MTRYHRAAIVCTGVAVGFAALAGWLLLSLSPEMRTTEAVVPIVVGVGLKSALALLGAMVFALAAGADRRLRDMARRNGTIEASLPADADNDNRRPRRRAA